MPHLLCFGYGYSASALARLLLDEGGDWQITGTATTGVGASSIGGGRRRGVVFDGQAPSAGVAAALRLATHVVVSVPPDTDGDPVLRHHAGDLEAAGRLRWIGYLSTVGVYGDQQGGWVDEESPPRPGSERSRCRLVAELAWRGLAERLARPVGIFRLAGIYGPGRSAIDNLRHGTARRIVKPGQVFNRIHVADIARVLAAAMMRDATGIYNVADDEPAPPQDVIAHAAGLLGMPPPPVIDFATAELSTMARSFYAECKRVRNGRLAADLGVKLRYPTYREGLAAILRAAA